MDARSGGGVSGLGGVCPPAGGAPAGGSAPTLLALARAWATGLRKIGGQGPMGRNAHRPCQPCRPERREHAPCHPERRRRSRWSFVILSAGGEATGVEGSHWSRTPAAATAYPVWEVSADRPGSAQAAAALRSSCHPERSESTGERSRRISLVAKACGDEGSSSVGMRAAPPGCADSAGKDFRPAEKRQSRTDGHVCPSVPLLMVLQPARSPYETSTNRRARGPRARRPSRHSQIGARPRPGRLVQVSCGCIRVGAASDLLAPAGGGLRSSSS